MPLPVPNPRTAVAGEFETAAFMNMFRDAVNFLTGKPNAVLPQGSAVTALANNGWTFCGLDTTTFDNYGGHSNTTNNSRYTAQVAGKYLVAGSVSFASNATGVRGARVAKNGTAYQGSGTLVPPNAALPTVVATAAVIVPLAVGDFVELHGFQSSGGALNTIIGADGTTTAMTVSWDST
jgi:hypothetical protein